MTFRRQFFWGWGIAQCRPLTKYGRVGACREDAEEAMNKTLSDMKTTLDTRMKEKMALEEERDYVKETVGKLQGQLSHTQAEVRQLLDVTSLTSGVSRRASKRDRRAKPE